MKANSTNFICRLGGKMLMAGLIASATMGLKAQDIIIKNDKSEFKAKVVEIGTDAVKYKEWDNQSGPLYNIAKGQLFMIIYQNGKKEFFKSSAPISATSSTSVSATEKQVESVSTSSEKDPRFIFTPIDGNQPKSATNYGDRFFNFGITLNSIGKTTIPAICYMDERIFWPNIALTLGITMSYNNQEIMGYKTTSFTGGVSLGPTYYLNELLKIDKAKASAYGGLSLSYNSVLMISDMTGAESSSASSFNIFLRAGGRYHFAKRLGAFGEIQIGKGDPAFVAGLSMLIFK